MADSLLAKHLLKDLYTYASDGMNYQLFEQPHRQMANFYESLLPPAPEYHRTAEQKYGMELAPRETLKTSLAQAAAEYFVVKMKVLYNYDARVLFVRANREASQSVLMAVKEDWTGNTVLTRAFGFMDLPNQSPLWTKEAITLPWRATPYREPTIDTAATGTTKTGYHFDLVICDDLANENNYMSEVEMAAARRYVQALLPIMNSWGSIILIGTRWSHLDPYGWVLDKNALAEQQGEAPPWMVDIHSCYNDDGTLYYPAYLTEARLAQKKRILDEKLFSANYLNVVMSDESMVFRKNEQRFYQGFYYPKTEMDVATLEVSTGSYAGNTVPVSAAIHVDPATSVAQAANFTGINVVLTDPAKRRWVHESLKVKEPPSDVVARILSLARYYQPDTISIDVLGQQVLWIDLLRAALDDSGLRDVPLTQYRGKDAKIGTGLIGKARRIESLQPLFREGLILLHEGACAPLVKELDTYDGVTTTNHFDVLDSLSHTVTVSRSMTKEQYQDRIEAKEMQDEEDDMPKQPRKVKATWAGR